MGKDLIKQKLSYKDMVSGGTHLVAALFSIFGIYYLTHIAAKNGGLKYWVSLEIFGFSMLLLYLASTTYHFINNSQRFSILFKK